ncbi:MAG: hypothetical protein WAV90_25085 [Gordonia amarae]
MTATDQQRIRDFAARNGYLVNQRCVAGYARRFDIVDGAGAGMIITWERDGTPHSAHYCDRRSNVQGDVLESCVDKPGHICWLLEPRVAPPPRCRCRR